MTGSALGRVFVHRQDTGSGFAVADRRVLTAAHVVRAIEPGPVRAAVEYRPEGAKSIPVTWVDVSTRLDVAVLHLEQSAPATLPVASSMARGDDWRVEARPKPSDPTLTGKVTDPHRQLENQRGEETILIQLRVWEEVGDYRGYSGSPVISARTGGVFGILVEQGRWRISSQPGQPPPVANILYAAPVGQVLTSFRITGWNQAKPVDQIPPPVPFEVDRLRERDRVIEDLLTGLGEPLPDGHLVGLVGLAGMPGVGKSALAAAAARDQRVHDAFPDGRFWLDLGRHPQLPLRQAELAAALGDRTPIIDVPQGRAQLSRVLAERRCLIVLDDVWNKEDLRAFAVVGPSGRLLVTTRDTATIAGHSTIELGEFAPASALLLLARRTYTEVEQLPDEALQVARECGYLPLVLAQCGAIIDAHERSWAELLDLLSHAGMEKPLPGYPYQSLAIALQVSIEALPQDARDRYVKLAVFDGQGPVPPTALRVLWELDPQPADDLIEELADKSLVRLKATGVSLHDRQMRHLVDRAGASLPALHDELLAAYAGRCHDGWATGPRDGYFHQHLAHHLRSAGRLQELHGLLLDPKWMNARLTIDSVPGLLADYDSLPSDPVVRFVADAHRLSAHVLADDPRQLPSQLIGRLTGVADLELRDLVERTRRWHANPWLRPLTASLTPPGGPMLRTLTGHQGRVAAVAITADGQRAISGGDDGSIQIWNLDTGEELRTLTGHHGRVATVAITADGQRAISGGDDGTVQAWNLETGEELHTLRSHYDGVRAVAVSADGRRAVSCGGRKEGAQVWDLATGRRVRSVGQLPRRPFATFLFHRPTRDVSIGAVGRRAVSGGDDETVLVWDLTTSTELRILTGHHGGVAAVAITADGRRAISGGDDGTIRVWNTDTGEELHSDSLETVGQVGQREVGWVITVAPAINAVAISVDGQQAISGGDDGTVRIWDLDTGEELRTLTGHHGPVAAVALTADGQRAISGGDDGTVRVWNLDTAKQLPTAADHDGYMEAVAISADGQRAISGGDDGTVRVWNLGTGKQLHILRGHDGWVRAVAVTANGRHAASGGDDGTVRIWDLDTGEELHTLRGHYDWVRAVTVSADSQRVVSGGDDGTLRIWDLDTGEALRTLTGHHGRVEALAVSADGQRAVSCGGPRERVEVWDLATGKRVAPVGRLLRHLFATLFRRTARDISVSAVGRRAVSGGSDGTLRIWDLATGKQLHALTGHHGRVEAVAISADGQRAVSGGSDGTVRIWDLATGKQLHTLTGHGDWVQAVAVSADGQRAVSCGDDGTVRVWDLDTGEEYARFTSENRATCLAATLPSTRVIVGTSTGTVHLLELCGCG